MRADSGVRHGHPEASVTQSRSANGAGSGCGASRMFWAASKCWTGASALADQGRDRACTHCSFEWTRRPAQAVSSEASISRSRRWKIVRRLGLAIGSRTCPHFSRQCAKGTRIGVKADVYQVERRVVYIVAILRCRASAI